MHPKHFPLFRLFNRKPRGQGVYLWLAGCQTGCLHFRQSLHTKLWNIFFIPFYPRNIFYILLNYSYSLFTDRNMDSSSWNAQRRKILARVRKAEVKKSMIQRFVPLKHLISNNIDQVRPLGRWKGACCRWISWLWSTWPVRSELLWGGHNPLIWVLMASIFLIFCLFLICQHYVLFGFIRGELLIWTWSIFLPFDFLCLGCFCLLMTATNSPNLIYLAHRCLTSPQWPGPRLGVCQREWMETHSSPSTGGLGQARFGWRSSQTWGWRSDKRPLTISPCRRCTSAATGRIL